jgi:aspartate/methionine/tyrosine aminotransferase
MREEFMIRRDIIVEGLNSIKGFSCIVPLGAFYAFPNITKTGYNSKELNDHLLYNGGVAALAGTSFGEFGEGYLRFSYANSRENILEAIKRIKKVL